MSEPTALEVDYRHQIAQLTKERDELAAKIDPMWRELVSHREKARENYWAWDKDEAQNYIESLVCPVLIHADDLMEILKDKDQLSAKCAEMRNAILKHKQFVDSVNPSPCKGDVELHAVLKNSDQCGVGWLSPEKKKVLVEALDGALKSVRAYVGQYNYDNPNTGSPLEQWKQALESCK